MRALLFAVGLTVALTACGDPPAPAQSPSEPSPTASPTVVTNPSPTVAPTTATESAGADTVELWFARDTPRGVFVEPETHALDRPTVAVARAALAALLEGQPTDPALTNLVPEGTRLLDVDLDGETLVVDLDFPDDESGLGSSFEAALYQQILHTGAQFVTVKRVEILEEGEAPSSGHLDSEEIRGPNEPDEFAISPIVIESPAHGETVDSGRVTVSGTANVFEANVQLRLVDPDGEVVEETFTTADCGTGCRGLWEHDFTIAEPGRWTVVATEPDASDGEGAGPFVTERTFTVR